MFEVGAAGYISQSDGFATVARIEDSLDRTSRRARDFQGAFVPVSWSQGRPMLSTWHTARGRQRLSQAKEVQVRLEPGEPPPCSVYWCQVGSFGGLCPPHNNHLLFAPASGGTARPLRTCSAPSKSAPARLPFLEGSSFTDILGRGGGNAHTAHRTFSIPNARRDQLPGSVPHFGGLGEADGSLSKHEDCMWPSPGHDFPGARA